MASIKDFRTRNEIVVAIAADPSKAVGQVAKQRGPVDPAKADDGILKRRIKKSGKVAFYDLGQVKDGAAWVDNPFTSPGDMFANSVTVIHRLDSPFSGEVFHTQFRNSLFETPVENWRDHFRPFTYTTGELYGIEVRDCYMFGTPGHIYNVGRAGSRVNRNHELIDGTDWTEEGLKIPADGLDQFCIQTFQGIYAFDNDPAKFKWTTGPTYASPAVPFSLGPRADIFLMPILVNSMVDGTNDTPGTANFVFGRYGVYSREFFLEKRYPNTPFGMFNYRRNQLLIDMTPTDYQEVLDFLRANRGPVREFRFAAGTITEKPIGWTTVDTWKTLQIGYDPFLTPPLRSFGSTGGAGMARGRLMAVVFQDDVYYYVWSGGTDPGTTILGADGIGLPFSY